MHLREYLNLHRTFHTDQHLYIIRWAIAAAIAPKLMGKDFDRHFFLTCHFCTADTFDDHLMIGLELIQNEVDYRLA